MRARLCALVAFVTAVGLLPTGPARADVVATVPVGGLVLSVAHDDARRRLWVANADLSVVEVDTDTHTVRRVIGLPHYAEVVGVHAAAGRVYVAGDSPARLSVIDAASGAVLAVRSIPEFPRRIAVDATRNRVYLTAGWGTVVVLDTAGTTVANVNVGGTPFGVDVDESRGRVYVVDGDGPRLVVLDAATNGVVAVKPLPQNALFVAVNTATDKLYLGGSAGTLVLDGGTLDVLATIPTGVGDLVADSAHNRIYTGDVSSNVLHVIDGATDTVLASFAVGARPVPVDVDAARRFVFVGNQDDGTISVALDDVPSGPPPPPPNQAPDCSGVTASTTTLWPANKALVPVTAAGGSDPDGDAVALAVTGVTQDEPLEDSIDAARVAGAPDTVEVRAERLGDGDGRVYRVAYSVTDVHGAACTGTVVVTVPKKPKAAAVDSGLVVDSFGA